MAQPPGCWDRSVCKLARIPSASPTKSGQHLARSRLTASSSSSSNERRSTNRRSVMLEPAAEGAREPLLELLPGNGDTFKRERGHRLGRAPDIPHPVSEAPSLL